MKLNKNKITNLKVLVTGGAGFIGSNLCEDLLKFNNKVICLDNFSTGYRNNISSFLTNPDFHLVEGDIRNLDDCKKATNNVDIVLHHAALGSVPRSLDDPLSTNNVNINGFLNMLIAAKDSGVKRFIYAASSSTYGDSEHLPKLEDNIGKPLSPYAVTKYVNELYAHVFGLNYGLECIGLRYFNVYGKRQSPYGSYAAVIPRFINSFLNLESPVINGSNEISRDFTHVKNVIQMNHLAATTVKSNAIGQVFNTAVGEKTTLLQLAEIIKKNLCTYDQKIEAIPLIIGPGRRGDVLQSLASIEKAKKILGYEPTHRIVEGIEDTVNWLIEQKYNFE
jgi:UDP-N-acetylglucosamine 4-epimerase